MTTTQHFCAYVLNFDSYDCVYFNWFHKTGTDLGKLAQKFVDRGQLPPDEMHPTVVPEKIVPSTMIAAAKETAYY